MILLAFFLTTLFPSSTPPRTARDLVRAIDARYRRAQTLRAAFYERYSDGSGGGSAESGTVYFSKPGRMRWEYESPQRKLFIVDGTNVWFYVPEDHTASRAKIAESSDWRTPLAFLAGKTGLTRLCQSIVIVDAANGKGVDPGDNATSVENTVLRCSPRENSPDPGERIREVLLEVDSDARLVRVLIRQPGKLETEFRFGNWEENLPIPETKFHFDPPSGVAIVDESALAGAIH